MFGCSVLLVLVWVLVFYRSTFGLVNWIRFQSNEDVLLLYISFLFVSACLAPLSPSSSWALIRLPRTKSHSERSRTGGLFRASGVAGPVIHGLAQQN